MTIPPVRDMTSEPNLFCELAPIDIDPIHGMDDPQHLHGRRLTDILIMDGMIERALPGFQQQRTPIVPIGSQRIRVVVRQRFDEFA